MLKSVRGRKKSSEEFEIQFDLLFLVQAFFYRMKPFLVRKINLIKTINTVSSCFMTRLSYDTWWYNDVGTQFQTVFGQLSQTLVRSGPVLLSNGPFQTIQKWIIDIIAG